MKRIILPLALVIMSSAAHAAPCTPSVDTSTGAVAEGGKGGTGPGAWWQACELDRSAIDSVPAFPPADHECLEPLSDAELLAGMRTAARLFAGLVRGGPQTRN